MNYYLIVGEASGDLHASHLIAALKSIDPEARFRGFGGDLMEAEGMTLVRHYRDLAYMGLFAVLRHLPTILKGMKECKADIRAWHPDVVILVDYPGFNLKIAKYVHDQHICPVFYYIAPKIWAWKEWRISEIRRHVDELFSILPFEVDFFEKKHHYPIHYVGNPTVDEIALFRAQAALSASQGSQPGASGQPLIALLPGSRTHEIRDNLPRMLKAASPWRDSYRLVVAGAPGIEPAYYAKYLGDSEAEIRFGKTYELLSEATAALVTSGTATLEAALLRVPQVVCFYMQVGRLASWVRKIILTIPYVSLVNLISGREVVAELIAEQMTPEAVRRHLADIMPGGSRREQMLRDYDEMARKLGEPGAPHRAAQQMVECLTTHKIKQ